MEAEAAGARIPSFAGRTEQDQERQQWAEDMRALNAAGIKPASWVAPPRPPDTPREALPEVEEG